MFLAAPALTYYCKPLVSQAVQNLLVGRVFTECTCTPKTIILLKNGEWKNCTNASMRWTLIILFALLLGHNKGKQLMVAAGQKPSSGPRYHRLHVQPTNNKIIEKMVSMKMSNCKNKINPHHSYCIATNLSNMQSRRWRTDEGALFHGANKKNSTRGVKINSLAKDKCKFGLKMEIFKLWCQMMSLSYFWCIKKMGNWTV